MQAGRVADIPAAKQNGYFSLLGSCAGRGGGISISGDTPLESRVLQLDIHTVGAIIFETLSLVTYTGERVSKIMAPTIKQFLSAGRDMGFGF